MRPLPPRSTLFPYTTLFRSRQRGVCERLRLGRISRLRELAHVGAAGLPVEVEMEERSEEHTSELQSLTNLVCRLLLEKKNINHHQQSLNRIAIIHKQLGCFF